MPLLPTPPTALIGRQGETRQVVSLLERADVRLVTLTGPGGTGKTRVALQVASEMAQRAGASTSDGDGWSPQVVHFVALASLSDPLFVGSAIVQAMGVREAGEQSILTTIQTAVQGWRTLLILDNFEHLTPAAPWVADLLAACPDLKLLVTSREPLHVQGEQEFPIPPLPSPDAVELFVQRARAVNPHLTLDQTTEQVIADLCRRLDGLPLAIELAASRTRLLDPPAMLARLSGPGGRLPLLTGGARDLPARQQTLRQTIGWSYDLLTDAEKALFRRLAVFAGGFTLDAAEAVAGESTDDGRRTTDDIIGLPSVADGIESLLAKSLLHKEESASALPPSSVVRPPSEPPRYIMLETIREYALAQLQASGEEPETRERHARFYLLVAQRAEPHARQADAAWLNGLQTEHDNLRGALHWLLESESPTDALRLAACLFPFWLQRGHWTEGRRWFEAALHRADEGQPPERATAEMQTATRNPPPSVRGRALFGLGALALRQGDWGEARQWLEESVVLLRASDTPSILAYALTALGEVWLNYADAGRARPLLDEGLALFRETGDRLGMTTALELGGNLAYIEGDVHGATALFQERTDLAHQVGHALGQAASLTNRAWEAYARGQRASAIQLMEEALAHWRAVGDQRGVVGSLQGLSLMLRFDGDFDRAEALGQEGVQRAEALGSKPILIGILQNLGEIARHRGNLVRARELHERGLALAEELDSRWGISDAHLGLAWIEFDAGELTRARGHLERALAIRRGLTGGRNTAALVNFLGIIARFEGDYAKAERLLRESVQLFRASSALPELVYAIERLAGVAAAQGQGRRAAALSGAAAGLRSQRGIEMPPFDRVAYDRDLALTRSLLDAAAFEEAWAKGETHDLDAAIAYALSDEPAHPPTTHSAVDWGGLTPREREVAALVAEGLSNRAIAERLVIGVRAVEANITRILTRLGFTSRAQIAAWAVERGLASAPTPLDEM